MLRGPSVENRAGGTHDGFTFVQSTPIVLNLRFFEIRLTSGSGQSLLMTPYFFNIRICQSRVMYSLNDAGLILYKSMILCSVSMKS